MPQDVVLRQGRAKPLWFGHPWVYSEAVARAEAIEPGDEVRVLDHDGRFIGRGFANPRSQILVRVASRRDEPLDERWLTGRLADARGLRAANRAPSSPAARTASRSRSSRSPGRRPAATSISARTARSSPARRAARASSISTPTPAA